MSTNKRVRARPTSRSGTPGISVPGFINNGGTFYFTELEVYADGLFECWGAVDLDFLQRKIESGWVSPGNNPGARTSIHGVMQGMVVSSTWTYDSDSLHERLLDCLRGLNPKMENVVDFEGDDIEMRGNVRCAKIGIMEGAPVRQTPEGSTLTGQSRWALVQENEQTFLTTLHVYPDGQIDVHPRDGEERLIDLEEFRSELEVGNVCLAVPDGTTIEIDTLGRFEITDVYPYVEQTSEFMKEIEDTVQTLNGEVDALTKCRQVYQAYLDNPTAEAKEELRQAYLAIPEHHRLYVGDMDSKDYPIRKILYGDKLR